MELVNACMTPRDNITSYDYTEPPNDVLGGVLGKLKDIREASPDLRWLMTNMIRKKESFCCKCKKGRK